MDNLPETMTSHFRTLHYVEVVYLKNGQPDKIKLQHYPPVEAERMFLRTLNKFRQEKTNAMLNLREENHQLIKSQIVKF